MIVRCEVGVTLRKTPMFAESRVCVHVSQIPDSARIHAVQCSLHAACVMRTSTSHYPKKV